MIYRVSTHKRISLDRTPKRSAKAGGHNRGRSPSGLDGQDRLHVMNLESTLIGLVFTKEWFGVFADGHNLWGEMLGLHVCLGQRYLLNSILCVGSCV